MNASNVPFSLLSVEATLEMATQCGDTVADSHADDPLLDSSLTALEEPKQQATVAIGSSQKQELTEKVNEADRDRDRGFIGFRKHVEADLYNDWNPAAREAANRLLNIIKKHGAQLYQEGLTVQSALMTSLFEDLAADQAKADLATLNLTEWITQLQIKQTNFTSVFMQRNALESVKDVPTKAEAKDALVQSLTVLFNGLEFLAATQPGTYAATNNLVNGIVNRIVTSERGR